jgi:hypothetical protein
MRRNAVPIAITHDVKIAVLQDIHSQDNVEVIEAANFKSVSLREYIGKLRRRFCLKSG